MVVVMVMTVVMMVVVVVLFPEAQVTTAACNMKAEAGNGLEGVGFKVEGCGFFRCFF